MRHFWIGICFISVCGLVLVGMSAGRWSMPGQGGTSSSLQAPLRVAQTQSVQSTALPQTPIGETLPPKTAFAQCGSHWSEQPRSIREGCSVLKETVIVIQETEQAATIVARPAQTRTPRIPRSTVVPAGVIPDDARRIEPIPAIDRGEGPLVLRRATSVWRLGAVLDSHGDYYRMVIYTSPAGTTGKVGYPKIGIFFMDAPPEVRARWEQLWECPEAIGEMTITSISGQLGIVSFTSASGTSGTFDLATQTWRFVRS